MMSFFKKVLSPFRRAGQETAAPTTSSFASRIAAASAIVLFSLPPSLASAGVTYRVDAPRFGEVNSSVCDGRGNCAGKTQQVAPGGNIETQWGTSNYYAPPRRDRYDEGWDRRERENYRGERRSSPCARGEQQIWVKDRYGNVRPECKGNVYWETAPEYVPDQKRYVPNSDRYVP